MLNYYKFPITFNIVQVENQDLLFVKDIPSKLQPIFVQFPIDI